MLTDFTVYEVFIHFVRFAVSMADFNSELPVFLHEAPGACNLLVIKPFELDFLYESCCTNAEKRLMLTWQKV